MPNNRQRFDGWTYNAAIGVQGRGGGDQEEEEEEGKSGAVPHLCENVEKLFGKLTKGGGGGGPLGRRDQLRLTCGSAVAPLWLDGATDALSRLIFLKIDF